MRICILGDSRFVPVRNLAAYLAAVGVDVHLVGFGELEIGRPFATRALPDSRLGMLFGRGRVRDLVGRIAPDVVHAFYLTSYGFLASRIIGTPILVTGMGSDVFGAPDLSPWLRPLRDALARRALRRADRIHSVADHMTERLIALGADRSRIVTFPRGVSLERFSDGSNRADSKGAVRLICNRKLEPVYDHETVISAAAILRARGVDFGLNIFDDGYLRPRLERQCATLGVTDRVRFHGKVSHDAMPTALHQSDIFVSASRSDGTSSCLLEAMAAGCIPVVSDIPANRPWIIEGESGFTFAPGTADALAHAVERAIHARERWPAIRNKDREIVQRQGSIDDGHHRVLKLYQEMLAVARGPE